jgi:hypothetical protein
MANGSYPSAIKGFRFLKQRELAPVSTAWDYQLTEDFSVESANKLFSTLPEDCSIAFFDPKFPREEAYLSVRRIRESFFVSELRQGSSGRSWKEYLFSDLLSCFMSSPRIQKPLDSFESFSIYSIPDHQRYWHRPKTGASLMSVLKKLFS